jgi:flavin reductase (DIM6/NTAB) family NADH-FMN oxidoreductase RutF
MMNDNANIVTVDSDWAYRLMGFGPLVLVTTSDGIRPDVSAIAWCCPCAKNPATFALAIGKRHKTYQNIMKTGYFGINIPTADLTDLVLYSGTVSGNKVDKFEERRIPYHFGKTLTKVPLLTECAAWLECKLVPSLETGDNSLIVGEAAGASCKKGVLTDDHTWNVEQFPTLHHLGGRSFLVGEKRIVAPPVKR